MDIELRDLKWIVVISQHRSLRQAAQTLNVRQSTLSRRLQYVEHRLDAELFERTNGGTHPTVAGLEFIEVARRILDETSAAFRRVRIRSRGENGRLTIGVYASLSAGNLHATLVEYHHRFPEVDVYTVDGSHDQLLRALTGHAVDVAVMTTVRLGWDDRALPLWSERVILALPEHHALAAHSVIRWQQLASERVLLPQHGPGPELERLLTTKLHDTNTHHVLHQNSGLDRLLSLVSAKNGLLLMLEGGTGMRCEGVTYREIHDDDGPTRLNFEACWRQSNNNPTLAPFLNMLRERYPDLSVAPEPT